ncbi:type II toxin-antitoxin system Phd/YefM family antitoxin [Fervidobacterium thailandense]|uniref:Antitoxin n=1 Tax=Fervidobacterium thailandense TaxID=1008305 RepID=A0A1E3G4G0_9BACT|nr:type II toxin-antitoxin system Phd/YefM family antitoxin [Fervidobacterium thailandense]ODN31010.1 prevent-host-death protein [Fervidobacterium thailandense]
MKRVQHFYPVAEVKAKLSEVLDQVDGADVVITRNGRPVAVMLSYPLYERLMDFIDKVWDLYLLDVGDPSIFKDLKLDELFNDFDENE